MNIYYNSAFYGTDMHRSVLKANNFQVCWRNHTI